MNSPRSDSRDIAYDEIVAGPEQDSEIPEPWLDLEEPSATAETEAYALREPLSSNGDGHRTIPSGHADGYNSGIDDDLPSVEELFKSHGCQPRPSSFTAINHSTGDMEAFVNPAEVFKIPPGSNLGPPSPDDERRSSKRKSASDPEPTKDTSDSSSRRGSGGRDTKRPRRVRGRTSLRARRKSK